MAKKNKQKFKESTIENYYDLKVDRVDELVAALKGDDVFEGEVNYEMNANMGVDDPINYTRRGKQREFDPYKIDKLSRVPTWLKAVFIKWWFAGVVSYFILWGLSISDGLDRIVLCGAVMGVVVDLLVNPIFRYMESDRKEYNTYMMFPFPFKAFWTFFANLIYYVFIMFFVNLAYTGFNELLNLIMGTEGLIHVGIEPLLFGVFCVMADMVFIGIKDGIVCLIRHRKNKKKETALNV